MTFSTSEHLPPSVSESESIQYRSITNIRIQLLEYFAELELNGNEFVYFSISEWYVNGLCKCNGHAETCIPQGGEELVDNKVTNKL